MRRNYLLLALAVTAAIGAIGVLGTAAAGGLQPTCAGAICLGSADQRPVYFIQDGIVRASLLSDGLVRTVPGTQTTAPAVSCGALDSNTTQTATAADLVETNLWSYTLKGGTLAANGRGVQITLGGVLGATANNKTIKVYVGATTIVALTTAANGSGWKSTSLVFRTGAATQRANADIMIGLASPQVTQSAPTETLSGDIVLRMTGQNGTAAANDIVFNQGVVECF